MVPGGTWRMVCGGTWRMVCGGTWCVVVPGEWCVVVPGMVAKAAAGIGILLLLFFSSPGMNHEAKRSDPLKMFSLLSLSPSGIDFSSYFLALCLHSYLA